LVTGGGPWGCRWAETGSPYSSYAYTFRKCVKNNFEQDIVFAAVKFSTPKSNLKEND